MESMMKPEKAAEEMVCPECKKACAGTDLYVCPECGKHLQISAKARLCMMFDAGEYEPWFEDVSTCDPLETPGYPEKLDAAKEKSGSSEAVSIGYGKIGGYDAVVGVCDPHFMMGSMGRSMGERITRAFEEAAVRRLPVIMFCCSGGARMQEGIISLMQMEKTSAAVRRHGAAGLFYCSVLTDPTMGGVTASFAMLADVILAEPHARIGFAGPRVIRQTLGCDLPKGFQTSEFMLEHGMIDRIVERKALKETICDLLKAHSAPETVQPAEENELTKEPAGEARTAWEKVKMCRSGERATAMDYIARVFEDFRELHGDRLYGDDQALVGGLAFLDGRPVTVLADLRGKTMDERVRRNFGMPKPEGYHKGIRLMKQAEKFGRPVITLINTAGAYCGVDAEERGQGAVIAESIMTMAALRVPTLAIFIGEGGSGGALATGVGNEVWMLEHATYAVLSPEGYSAILWKTEGRAEEAAGVMKLTAQDLQKLGVIDRIIPEFGGATEKTADQIAAVLRGHIAQFLQRYCGMTGEEIAAHRYARFRKY